MADNTYRVQFFFEGIQPARSYSSSMVGWTETWYFTTGVDINGAITAVPLSTYVTLRRAFMPSYYRIVWIRISDVANPRQTKTRAVLDGLGQYSGPPQALPEMITSPDGTSRAGTVTSAPTAFPNVAAAQVTCAVLVDFMRRGRAAGPPPEPSHHRRFLVRGLPADLINGNIISTFSQSFRRLQQFLQYLGNHESGAPPVEGTSPFLLRYLNPAVGTTYPISDLTVFPDNHKRLDLTATGLPALARGQRVQVFGVKDMDRVNRLWTVVTNGAAGGPTLIGDSRKDIFGGPGRTGFARVGGYEYNPADQYLIIGMRTKGTGRPFRLTRGRRRIL